MKKMAKSPAKKVSTQRRATKSVEMTTAPLADEALGDKTKRVKKILAGLHTLYPDATCALEHVDAFQLLIATILSAQSTDVTVNKVTPVLFAKYPTPAALARAQSADVEKIIHQTGFFRQKTKSVIGASQAIVERFDGKVPTDLESLITLPGVARKTANVVLGTAFGKNEGVVVDTHVGRLATRLGLTWTAKNPKDAVRIEQDLMQIVQRDEWTFFGHSLIWHGRKVCDSRKPKCSQCLLAKVCPSAGTFDNQG